METRDTQKPRWTRQAMILLGVGIALSLVTGELFSQEPSGAKSAKPATSSSRSKEKDAQIEQKLDQILANQQAILQKFDAMMEELRIIKVRTTINRGS